MPASVSLGPIIVLFLNLTGNRWSDNRRQACSEDRVGAMPDVKSQQGSFPPAEHGKAAILYLPVALHRRREVLLNWAE